MQFLYPEILWALAAVSIPVIVHLFNFRRFKKVPFPNVAFLKEVKQETQSKSRLKHLLILLSRMLAMACVILAFAQPFIPSTDQTNTAGDRAVSVYIDNSFSMEAENEDGRLLELAKSKALEVVDFYRPTDKFQLITNDFEGRHQRLISKDEIIDLIDEVQVSSSTRMLSDVFARQRDVLSASEYESKTAYVISDLQTATHDIEGLANDSTVQVRMVPNVAGEIANVSIDSVWFSSPVRQLNQPEELSVRIRNHSREAKDNIQVKLFINGTQKALGTVDIPAKESSDATLSFTHTEAGFKKAELRMTDHPIVFDDVFYFGYEVAEQINVLEIKSEANNRDFIGKIFSNDPYFVFESLPSSALNYSEFNDQNLIILNQVLTVSSGMASELSKFVENGGGVLFFPSDNGDISSYNNFLSAVDASPISQRKEAGTKVSDINLDHGVFQGVFSSIPENIDLPEVSAYFVYERSSRSGERSVMTLRNGDSFLSEYELGNGKVYTSAVSLDPGSSNLAEHALFVTANIRIAELSQPTSRLYYTVGEDDVLKVRHSPASADQAYHIKHLESGLDFLPGHRRLSGNTEIYVYDQLKDAGCYELTYGDDVVEVSGFNYSRAESKMAFFDIGELKTIIEESGRTNIQIVDSGLESLQKQVSELDEGKKLWHTLVILALIFLALEVLLIKFWK